MAIPISDLTQLTTPADGDFVPIVDVSANSTKKITREDFFKSPPLAEGSITPEMLSAGVITLGYAQVTSSQTGISSTSGAQLTGLTVTVTIPPGGRNVEVTVFITNSSNNGNNTNVLQIWDGTVGSGTQLNASVAKNRVATDATGFMICTAVVVAPAAGSKTYNAGFAVDANIAAVVASATTPAYILVKLI